jgi:hypothetical protein
LTNIILDGFTDYFYFIHNKCRSPLKPLWQTTLAKPLRPNYSGQITLRHLTPTY